MRAKFSAFAVAAGILCASETTVGCLRPDGTSDDPYIAAGQSFSLANQIASGATNQTILLTFTIPFVYEGTSYVWNTSATLIDGENAITTADNLSVIPYSTNCWISTGPNYATNAGTLIMVDHIAQDPNNYVAVLHLSGWLPNVHTKLATTQPTVGEIVIESGFGYSGTPNGGPALLSGNSEGWHAPRSQYQFGNYPGTVTFSTDFRSQFPPCSLNAQGMQYSSGGFAANGNNEYNGLTIGGAAGQPVAGFTTCIDISQDNPSAYDFIINNLIHSQPTVSITNAGSEGTKVTVTGKTNQIYCVQRSFDLENWTNLITLTNITGTVTYSDPDATNNAVGFYRTIVK